MTPEYLRPFVLPTKPCLRERQTAVDFSLPPGESRCPAVVFVHGGPIPETTNPAPSGWPVYLGYGQAVAERGAVGAMFDHRLRDVGDLGGVPIVLTPVGLEKPEIAATVTAFLARAEAEDVPVHTIDVPNGRHGFDYLDDTDESRDAIIEGIDAVLARPCA